jgi:hypothetical protein
MFAITTIEQVPAQGCPAYRVFEIAARSSTLLSPPPLPTGRQASRGRGIIELLKSVIRGSRPTEYNYDNRVWVNLRKALKELKFL